MIDWKDRIVIFGIMICFTLISLMSAAVVKILITNPIKNEDVFFTLGYKKNEGKTQQIHKHDKNTEKIIKTYDTHYDITGIGGFDDRLFTTGITNNKKLAIKEHNPNTMTAINSVESEEFYSDVNPSSMAGINNKLYLYTYERYENKQGLWEVDTKLLKPKFILSKKEIPFNEIRNMVGFNGELFTKSWGDSNVYKRRDINDNMKIIGRIEDGPIINSDDIGYIG